MVELVFGLRVTTEAAAVRVKWDPILSRKGHPPQKVGIILKMVIIIVPVLLQSIFIAYHAKLHIRQLLRLYTVFQRTRHSTFGHNFARCTSIFEIRLLLDSQGNCVYICRGDFHLTSTALLL